MVFLYLGGSQLRKTPLSPTASCCHHILKWGMVCSVVVFPKRFPFRSHLTTPPPSTYLLCLLHGLWKSTNKSCCFFLCIVPFKVSSLTCLLYYSCCWFYPTILGHRHVTAYTERWTLFTILVASVCNWLQ